MIRNKKGILILVISLVAIYLLIGIISIIPTGKKYKNTAFIGASTKVEVNKGAISVYDEDKKIAKQDVKIYFKNNFVDGYVTSAQNASSGLENAYMFYDKNGDNLITNSIFIATTPDLKIDVKDSKTQEIENIDVINDILALNNLNSIAELELNYAKIDYLDVDNDGIEDKIYSVGIIKENIKSTIDDADDYETEEFYLDDEEEFYDDESFDETEDEDEEIDETEDEDEEVILDQDYISFVYLKKGNSSEYILIQKYEGSYDGISNERLSFAKLIDFNNDGNYEFVIEKMMSEYGPYYYQLYNFDDNKFTKIGGK